MGFIGKNVLLTLIALCYFTTSVFTTSPSPIKLPTISPTKAPIKLPTLPPTKLPTLPPTKIPTLPPVYPPKFNNNTLLAVQGKVYCISCRFPGIVTNLNAKPVKDAVVTLICKKNKNISTTKTKTDKNGYFLLLGPNFISNYDTKDCRAYQVKSPNAYCSTVTYLFNRYVISILRPVMKHENSTIVINKLTYSLYNVGPFAFEPTCP